jgi:hypothetical protein
MVGIGGLFTRRRSYFILWTGWLIAMAAVFSDVFIFHSYYTTALSPPIAAIIGAGAAGLWESRTEVRSVAARRDALAAVLVAGTVVYGIWLIRSSGATPPTWLWPLAASMGAAAVVLLMASTVVWSHRWLVAVALVVGVAAVLVIPAAGSGSIVSQQRSFSDTPFESAKTAAMYEALLGTASKGLRSFFPQLEKLQMGSPYVMAVYTSAVASEFISATGKEVLPIGGFTGSIPEPTVSQLEGMIRAAKFHLALLLGGHDPRLTWIASHCSHLGPGGGSVGLFICEPKDVPAARR